MNKIVDGICDVTHVMADEYRVRRDSLVLYKNATKRLAFRIHARRFGHDTFNQQDMLKGLLFTISAQQSVPSGR